jgi:glutamate/aspartate transport system substrate-binding protein
MPKPMRHPSTTHLGAGAPALRAAFASALARLCQAAALAGALGTLAPPVQAGAILDRIKQSGRITIAHREASVPFSYLDAQGRPVGYAMDICQRLVEAVARRVEHKALAVDLKLVTSATRIPTMADAGADLECESTTNTAERRERVAFTVPHYITGARLLVRADSPINELRDLERKRLVSTTGTTPLKTITQLNRERLLGVNIGDVPDHARGIEMVEKGEADAFLMDEVLLIGLVATRPDPAKLKVVGKYLTIEPLAIMLPKGDPEFKRVVDDEMKRLIRSGEALALHDKWFTKPIPPQSRNLNLPINYLLRDFWKYPSDWVPN